MCTQKKGGKLQCPKAFSMGSGSSWRLACQLIVDPGSWVFGRFPPFSSPDFWCKVHFLPVPASWVSCWAQCQPVVNYHRPTDDLTADAWPTPGSCRRQFFQNYFNFFGAGTIRKLNLFYSQKNIKTFGHPTNSNAFAIMVYNVLDNNYSMEMLVQYLLWLVSDDWKDSSCHLLYTPLLTGIIIKWSWQLLTFEKNTF